MKTFRIKDHFQEDFGEYVLGPHELGNKIGYMVWGEMKPGEKRVLNAGKGHEEILLVIEGTASAGADGSPIGRGEAIFVPSGGAVPIAAGPQGCTYVSAGAHVEDH